MALITVDVEIRGTTALLQHRFTEEAQAATESSTRKVKRQNQTPREQAEKACYRDHEGYLYHPGAAVMRGLREAGGYHKQKSSRKSLKYVVPAAVLVLDDAVPIFDGTGKKRLKDFEVDSRPVVIPSTKGRIMRHRPRCDEWSMKFRVRINNDLLDEATIEQLLVQFGEQIGLGDFRPERGGPFGTFRLISWTSHRDEEKAKPRTKTNGAELNV